MDAKKDLHQKSAATALIADAHFLHAARGKKVVDVDLRKTDLTIDETLKWVLGPTGNLRAPTLRVGKKLIVGFNEDMYNDLLN